GGPRGRPRPPPRTARRACRGTRAAAPACRTPRAGARRGRAASGRGRAAPDPSHARRVASSAGRGRAAGRASSRSGAGHTAAARGPRRGGRRRARSPRADSRARARRRPGRGGREAGRARRPRGRARGEGTGRLRAPSIPCPPRRHRRPCACVPRRGPVKRDDRRRAPPRRSSPLPMLLPIFLVVLVDVFAFTLVFPLLAIYAEHFGATPLEATLLVSVFAVCQLVSGPLLGRVSDRVGRKPMLLVGQAGTFVGLLVMGGARSLWMLYLARVIDGATAGNLSLAQAYIADNTAPENRSRAFALIGIAFGLGFFLGPSVTGYLVKYGLRAPIWAAAGLSLASFLCTTVVLPNQAPRRAAAGAMPGGERLAI